MNATNERDWIEEVGPPAYAALAEMVAALQADYDRLEELRERAEELQSFIDDPDCNQEDATRYAADIAEFSAELAELEAAVTLDGYEVDEDGARERIMEDPLSLRIFGERVEGEWQADNYELLLTTGGPAVRIIGDLDGNGEAASARLQVQDWGKPWTDYYRADSDVLMAYVGCFYFGE